MNKCHKCKKPIHRNEVYEKNAGYFHQSCWYDWKKKKAQKEADKKWQEKGIEVYGDKCFCGDKASCCHHFFYKSSYPALRYNLKNAVPICAKHHMLIHSQDPKELNDWIISIRGEKWYQELKKEAQTTPLPQTSISYYENVIKDLT